MPRGLTEIAEAKQVRFVLYQFRKRVRESILTFRTKDLVDFFFKGGLLENSRDLRFET